MNEHDSSDTARDTAREHETPPPSPTPPKGPRVRWILAVVALAAVMLWIGASWGRSIGSGVHDAWQRIAGTTAEAPAEPHDHDQWYTCGMHPWVLLPEPGLCPVCQMELTPVDPQKFTDQITIDPVVTQNIGVRIAPVTRGPLTRTIRTVGKVAYDETRVRDVNVKVGGWIEKLYVDWVGAPVEKGQPLFDMYSPELYSAQQEYLSALKARRHAAGAAADVLPQVTDDTERQVRSARTRLEFFDIPNAQIDALEKAGTPQKTMTITSPYAGLVVDKQALEGMEVRPGMRTYRIADLSSVWVTVTVYEDQLAYVHAGQPATMTLAYDPGKDLEGKVTYVYPWVDERTREVQVRLEFPNPALQLKPGMFATIELRSTLAEDATLAPRAAVLDTGARQIAFVSLGGGKFEPRQVTLGAETRGGEVQVLDGLRPGDMVVVNGQFLLDSESKFREALLRMIRGEPASAQPVTAKAAGGTEIDHLPAAAANAITDLLDAYLRVQPALAADTIDGVGDAAANLAAAAERLQATVLPDPHFWHRHSEASRLVPLARALADEHDLEQARLQLADLSAALDSLLKATGVPATYGKELQGFHCPMYRKDKGGDLWLQVGGEPHNPYFGARMIDCFDDSWHLPVTDVDRATSPAPAPESHDEAPPTEHGAMLAPPTEREPAALDDVLRAYLALHQELAHDRLAGVADRIAGLRKAAATLADGADPELAEHGHALQAAITGDVSSLDSARKTFLAVSNVVIPLVHSRPPSADVAPALRRVQCPMYPGAWLQVGEDVENPYYGPAMRTCGSVQEVIEARPGGEPR